MKTLLNRLENAIIDQLGVLIANSLADEEYARAAKLRDYAIQRYCDTPGDMEPARPGDLQVFNSLAEFLKSICNEDEQEKERREQQYRAEMEKIGREIMGE